MQMIMEQETDARVRRAKPRKTAQICLPDGRLFEAPLGTPLVEYMKSALGASAEPVIAALVDGKLVLRWAVSSKAALEVSPAASGAAWTHAGLPEIKDGTYYYEVEPSSKAAYFRLISE